MKKVFFISLILITGGLIVGNNLYNKIDFKLLQTFNENNTYYLLQAGIYNSEESMHQETKNLNNKIYEYKNDKYYVYIAITGDKDNANKISSLYEEKGININIKEIEITDEEFINNMTQFDILIKNTSSEDEIETIEEIILSSYDKKILNK